MTNSRSLLNSQRNGVFEVLRVLDWEPGRFTWVERRPTDPRAASYPALCLTNSPYFFGFDRAPVSSTWLARFSPGREGVSEQAYEPGWDQILDEFGSWLQRLRRETEEPDLWETYFADASPVQTLGESDDDRPYSDAERAEIRLRLEAVRVYLIEQGTSGEALADVDEKLAYLKEALERLGRRDWKNVALSVAFQIGLAAAFSPDQARHIANLLLTSARQLLGG